MNIKLDNVSFKYRGSRKDVLRDISLEIPENRICGLLGKNGVGKSTLLYLIAGLLKSQHGSVKMGDMETHLGNPKMLQDIFLVPEEFNLPGVTLSDFVKMNRPFYPRFSDAILSACLDDFEMPADIKLSELSMGQKKKVYMSFALATMTQVLLMDEPTNGLDIPSKAQFRKAVSRSMSDDRIIIISTHQVHDVEQLLDHIVILSNEGVLMNKTTAEIADEYVFETRSPQDMDDAIYAEPSLQGNLVMAPRNGRPETNINVEILFNAVTSGGKKM